MFNRPLENISYYKVFPVGLTSYGFFKMKVKIITRHFFYLMHLPESITVDQNGSRFSPHKIPFSDILALTLSPGKYLQTATFSP